MELGSRIRDTREKLNMSQDELAQKMNMSRQAISKWETGKSYPDIEKLLKLADIYGLSLDELVRGDERFKQNLIKECKAGPFGLAVFGYIFIALGVIVIAWGGAAENDFLSYLDGGLFLTTIGLAVICISPRWLLLGSLYALGAVTIIYLISFQMKAYVLWSGIVVVVGLAWWLTTLILKKR